MPTLWRSGILVVPNELWFLAFMLLCSSFPLWLWPRPCDRLWLMGQQQAQCKCRPDRHLYIEARLLGTPVLGTKPPVHEKAQGTLRRTEVSANPYLNSSQGPRLTASRRNEAMLRLLANLVLQPIPNTYTSWSTHRIMRNNKLNYIVVVLRH